VSHRREDLTFGSTSKVGTRSQSSSSHCYI